MTGLLFHDNTTNIELIGSPMNRILKTTKQDRATHSMLSAAFRKDNEVK